MNNTESLEQRVLNLEQGVRLLVSLYDDHVMNVKDEDLTPLGKRLVKLKRLYGDDQAQL